MSCWEDTLIRKSRKPHFHPSSDLCPGVHWLINGCGVWVRAGYPLHIGQWLCKDSDSSGMQHPWTLTATYHKHHMKVLTQPWQGVTFGQVHLKSSSALKQENLQPLTVHFWINNIERLKKMFVWSCKESIKMWHTCRHSYSIYI